MKKPYETPTLTRGQNVYSGVCIGGPLAGKMLTSATRSYSQAERMNLPDLTAKHPDVDATTAVRVHRYRFTEGFMPDGNDIASLPMWLHDEVPSLVAAFKILGDSYIQANRKK